tara:strand:+ start:2791 stop:2910 length:120 start_codon:yes stop_codon:yes gene_type:complete
MAAPVKALREVSRGAFSLLTIESRRPAQLEELKKGVDSQ